jgi:heme-degrading monooxygenase HmoA
VAVLEVAVLKIRAGQSRQFETAFQAAEPIVSSMRGYISHDLHRCIEQEDQYLLLVRWNTLEDHRDGFRSSPGYLEWKRLLHHFYHPFPTVEHYVAVDMRAG